MIRIERYINELMSSNCYIVWDDVTNVCIVIDPASEYSLQEIRFINSHNLTLDYILLTHEHTDHTWGVNSLLTHYSKAKVVCSQACKDNFHKAGDMYFQLYYERRDYHYEVERVDYTVEELGNSLNWDDNFISFINTPGHSIGSICIDINGILFSGDTIMQTKPYINKKNGNRALYARSYNKVLKLYCADTEIYPGHGNKFILKDSYDFVL